MKNLILSCFILSLFVFKVNGQELQAKIGNAYVLVADTRILKFDLATNENTTTTFDLAKKGYIFDLVKVKKETVSSGGLNKEVVLYVIKFWEFKNKSKNLYIGEDENENYFTIKASDFIETCVSYKKENGVSFGALVMPIKLRFGDGVTKTFDFSTDVGIGTSIGYRWGLHKTKEHNVNLLLGVGISAISADSLTTNGFLEKTTTLAAFTPSLGLLFEFGRFQTGIFVGLDVIPNEVGKQWVHQNIPWLSVGIGVQILSNDQQSDKPNKVNKNGYSKIFGK